MSVPEIQEAIMIPLSSSRVRLAVTLLSVAVVVACSESDPTGPNPAEPDLGPTLLRATPGNAAIIMATFDRPLNPGSVRPEAFRVGGTLANGRGVNLGSPVEATYRSGETSVQLRMRSELTGTGTYTVRAHNIEDEEGRKTEVSAASFEFAFEVMDPKSFVIREIEVTGFPATRPDGSQWDGNGTGPDIYVHLQFGLTPFFISTTEQNAAPTGRYRFSDGNPSLPYDADVDVPYSLSIVDNDVGGNERMDETTVVLSRLYRRDNAVTDALTVHGALGFKAILKGDWTY